MVQSGGEREDLMGFAIVIIIITVRLLQCTLHRMRVDTNFVKLRKYDR